MGLTNSSTGIRAVDSGLEIRRQTPEDRVVALAGNPNVGKSTVFNGLTGLNQHTGNWPGKTVASAQGFCATRRHSYVMVDIPGTYSLMAHSAEEEVARNFICFGEPDAVVVVCDATCLERNLNLVLQTMEISSRVLVCVNLLDEAKRKGIQIDLEALSERLGVPVVGAVARKKQSLGHLMSELDRLIDEKTETHPLRVRYLRPIEDAIGIMEPLLRERFGERINPRWLSLRLLDAEPSLMEELKIHLGRDPLDDPEISAAVLRARDALAVEGITGANIKDKIVSCLVLTAEDLCLDTVTCKRNGYNTFDRRIDRILTSRWAGYPIMLLLLALVFWLTITGANIPSRLLADLLFRFQDTLTGLFLRLGAPDWLHGMLVLGAYRVLAWVVSVMLPPMAIFFPLFTLLEDSGYLPRIAYNLDKPFKKCSACGKQALTMCMGFGCNAAGIVGCRIIDSPRERLIAMITNNFVPCNGRFPMLIAMISIFFAGAAGGAFASLLSALMLTGFILLGIFATFAVSKLLSVTVLKGVPSSFTLELPPYRRPQIGRVIVRSIFDRTLFVLGRAAAVAAPAGLLLWLLANMTVGGQSLLAHCAGFLDPFARLLGLDGVILTAFLLGLPANEIVLPIIIMSYLSQGSILELESLTELYELLSANGWTWVTAVSVMLFSLMHWPCSTTLITIRRETGSLKWAAVSFLIPTLTGFLLCFLFANTARLLF
ncbi:ferrous iron transport protein B [Yanshouia hominis]|uniref:Ferrous iron transport protein B n=1 Tax=Yanshouia hominis TaxID=2763673 RepID=A0ABR7NK18_9FIRM|nr:ferrous iron transport protein B [Yanshouia hominis]MBC8576751.1 ferrous iron transport protein B [Yanshouia hominis]